MPHSAPFRTKTKDLKIFSFLLQYGQISKNALPQLFSLLRVINSHCFGIFTSVV